MNMTPFLDILVPCIRNFELIFVVFSGGHHGDTNKEMVLDATELLCKFSCFTALKILGGLLKVCGSLGIIVVHESVAKTLLKGSSQWAANINPIIVTFLVYMYVEWYNMREIGASRFQLADLQSPTVLLIAILPTLVYFFFNVTSNIFTGINELKTIRDGHMTSILENGSRLQVQFCTQFIASLLTGKDSCVANHTAFDFLDNLSPFLPYTHQQGVLFPHFSDHFIELLTAYTPVIIRPFLYPHFTQTEFVQLVLAITFFAALYGRKPLTDAFYTDTYPVIFETQLLQRANALFSAQMHAHALANLYNRIKFFQYFTILHLEDKVYLKGGE
ncbi:hypothetical protein Hdeb2414_s0009g00318561 [Helianthus debilis subsp. tardiflorus]